jgi:N-acetylmuramoyl-L-alanine amidase
MIFLKRLKYLFLIYFSIYFFHLPAQNNQINDYRLKKVVIDPGHGGKDPGSVGKITMEKHVVLGVALKLGEYIEKNYPDVQVIYTRKTDEFIPLYKRAEIANLNKADLFISIHANGNPKKDAFGTETLVLGEHRAEENFEVAKRENSVIEYEEDYSVRYQGFDPDSPESYIMLAFMQRVYFGHSIHFAQIVQDQFRERAKRKDRGVKQQGLLVLAQTSMPGVLIETGFVTNPDEEKYLASDDGQDYIASAIFRAFKDYKLYIESHSAPVYTSLPAIDTNPVEITTIKNEIPEVQKNTPVQKGEIEFKVQISASSRPIPLNSAVFKDLSDLQEYEVNGNYKYLTGSKKTYNEIVEYSKKIKNRFPDAFVVALKDGKIISMEQALRETKK